VEQGRKLCSVFEHLTNRSQVECRQLSNASELSKDKIKKKKNLFPSYSTAYTPSVCCYDHILILYFL
jgi:hypothetical protein